MEEVKLKYGIKSSDEEKYKLFKRLMEIDDAKFEKLNKKFGKKRLINIYFLIIKF